MRKDVRHYILWTPLLLSGDGSSCEPEKSNVPFPLRATLGPDWKIFVSTIAAYLIGSMCWCFIMGFLIDPSWLAGMPALFAGIGAGLTMCVAFFHTFTAMTDPGFVYATSKNENAPVQAIPMTEEEIACEQPVDIYIARDAHTIVCGVCAVLRPPGARHCDRCGRCIQGLDHHCGFMGQCVGKLNLRTFRVLLFFSSALSYWTSGTGCYILIRALISVLT